jgi:FtsP/CotA-like multicopper oxidase with cupredoxin domain
MLNRRSLLAGGFVVTAMARSAGARADEPSAVLEFAARQVPLLGPDGPFTTVWAAGGTWPPPVLRARQGEPFTVRLRNLLDQDIALHWYGVRAAADVMSVRVAAGSENALDCTFTPPDAGTFCFGPIADVSLLREMGVYGLLVVEERNGLGELHDVPLIIDDWRVTDAGRIDPESFGSLEDAIGQGRLGNWFTINGASRPRIAVPRARVARLRLLNAANVRTMSLLFKGADPLVAALDGQPIAPRSIGAAPLVLAPMQRCDLLLPEGDEDVTVALDLFEDVVELAHLFRTGEAGAATLPDNFRLPANPVPLAGGTGEIVTAPLIIEGGAGGGMKSARVDGQVMELRALLEQGLAWSLNGTAGMAREAWLEVTKGTQVRIELDNRTRFEQPLHIHGHVWRIEEQDGKPLADAPWRDTVTVGAGKKSVLGFVADNPGRWGLHSSIAERMDAGLMTSFIVRA